MAANHLTSNHTAQANSTTECSINLAYRSADNDWTQAIHHGLNIKRRTCNTFIPKIEGTTDATNLNVVRCGCKRLRREHSWDVVDGGRVKWDKKQHTGAAYNNAYGLLPRTGAKYIRCDIQTAPKKLATLLFEVWKVEKPQLIMCVIGGAKYFKLSERLEREFMKGIIRAALKANGWLVTTGFKTGVVELVGEAIHDHRVTDRHSRITAIGCSKWGAVKDREALMLRKPPADPNLNASQSQQKAEKGQQVLEENHTHFLLLDDGTYFGYDTGDYRTRFVLEASSYTKEDVPIVTIVVEGGPDTLRTIYRDLRSHIPIVLIDGSGRVPNLLASFLARTEPLIDRSSKTTDEFNAKNEIDIQDASDIEKLKSRFRPYEEDIRSGLRDIAKGSQNEKEFNELYYVFLYCLQPAVRGKIQVFSLDGDHNLDDTIFEAIIQAKQQKTADGKKPNKEQLLRLALAWDAIDVAKEHIIKDDLSDFSEKAKRDLLLLALRKDRPQFVHAFLKLNYNVAQLFYQRGRNQQWHLIGENLVNLYTSEEVRNSKHYYLLRKCLEKEQVSSVEDIDRLLRKLIGDYMKSIYAPGRGGVAGKFRVCCQFSRGRVADSRAELYGSDEEEGEELLEAEEAEKEAYERTCRDLFFWAILTNRIKMCLVLLSHMQTRICASLIASKVLKSYQKYAHNTESKEILAAQAEEFEGYAKESLKCCCNFDEQLACELAIRRIKLFGGVTCLQVAVSANDKIFVGEPCCDQLLENVWYDKMEPFESSTVQRLKTLLSICTLGLLAPALLNFRKREQDPKESSFKPRENYKMTVNQDETNEDDAEEQRKLLLSARKRLKSHGIDYSEAPFEEKRGFCLTSAFTYFRQLKHFHEAPFIKFSYNIAGYVFFLLLFSYFLLFNFNTPTDGIPSIHWTEILVIIIVSTMLVEDIRKFLCQENRSFAGKLSNYLVENGVFSSIRIGAYVLFYLGLILRFTEASDEVELSIAKIVLAYDLEIWFLRSLGFLGIARHMGPKLVMIRRMVVDLSFFICIILVAMIGYGVASRAMYNFDSDADPDDLTFDGRSIFRHIVYPVYYLMYGSQDNELTALDRNPDAGTAIATQVLLAFHMLFVNILLVNLLIAMFSFTFESVQTQTDLIWRYERYSLVYDYFDRPPLFPPLIILTHFIELLKLISRHLPQKKSGNSTVEGARTFKMVGFDRQIDKQWSEFESYATNLYIRSILSGQPSSAAVLVPSIAHRKALQSADEANILSQTLTNVDIKAVTDELTAIKRTIGELRTHSEEMNRCMQWMMGAMARVKMSREPPPALRSALTITEADRTDD